MKNLKLNFQNEKYNINKAQRFQYLYIKKIKMY